MSPPNYILEMSFEGPTLCCGVSPTVVKGATSCFQGVWILSGYLGEFQLGLMLDDMEDLINQEVQGVKVMESSVFVVVGGASFLGVGA